MVGLPRAFRFDFGASERFEFGKRGEELWRRDAERGLEWAGGIFSGSDTQVGGVAVVASEDAIQRRARGSEVFRYDRERDGARDHWFGENAG